MGNCSIPRPAPPAQTPREAMRARSPSTATSRRSNIRATGWHGAVSLHQNRKSRDDGARILGLLKMGRILTWLVVGILAMLMPSAASAALCTRQPSGSEVTPPPDLYRTGAVLTLTLNYLTNYDGPMKSRLICFQTPEGLQSPTLHVHPGDIIKLKLVNTLPKAPGAPSELVSSSATRCGATTMQPGSVNLHFHGLNVPPQCHADEV